MTTVAFTTLGCRVNQADTQQLQALLSAHGFGTAPPGVQPDVVVVNTCTVTARAEASDRQAIRRAVRLSPAARVVVTGCWAQTSADAVGALEGVDLVVGHADQPRLPELLSSLLDGKAQAPVAVGDVGAARLEAPAWPPRAAGRARVFLKIQDGCQHRCAFCIVPRARGASRSLPPAAVEEQTHRLVAAGHPEVVLTGVDLGHYGADLRPRTSLADLLVRLGQVPGLRWLRLSSLLPTYLTEELLAVLAASTVIVPHLHLPLQSGSDAVLRAMRRPYTAAMYRRVVERLAAAIPRLGLGADILVGFPGETEADAAQTLALVEALPFTYLHVFPYSARQGTEAAARPGRPQPQVVAARASRLRAASAAARRRFVASLVGQTQEVLVLETRDRASGDLVGLTGNNVGVTFPGPDGLQRRLVRVRLTAAGEAAARGCLEAA